MEFLPRHCAVCGSGESHPRPGSSRTASPACHTRPVLLLSLCTSSSGIPSPPPRPWPLLRAVHKAGGKHGPGGFPCSVPAFKPGAVGSRGCRNTELGTAEQSCGSREPGGMQNPAVPEPSPKHGAKGGGRARRRSSKENKPTPETATPAKPGLHGRGWGALGHPWDGWELGHALRLPGAASCPPAAPIVGGQERGDNRAAPGPFPCPSSPLALCSPALISPSPAAPSPSLVLLPLSSSSFPIPSPHSLLPSPRSLLSSSSFPIPSRSSPSPALIPLPQPSFPAPHPFPVSPHPTPAPSGLQPLCQHRAAAQGISLAALKGRVCAPASPSPASRHRPAREIPPMVSPPAAPSLPRGFRSVVRGKKNLFLC